VRDDSIGYCESRLRIYTCPILIGYRIYKYESSVNGNKEKQTIYCLLHSTFNSTSKWKIFLKQK